MDAFNFLQQIQNHTEGNIDVPRTVLGFIDPDFDPSKYPQVLPRVIIDGQGKSNKGYPCLSSYNPAPSDRVFLVPHNTSFLIIGAFDRTDNTLLHPGQLVFQAFQTVSQDVPDYNSNPANITPMLWQECPLDLVGGWEHEWPTEGPEAVSGTSRFQPNIPGWYEFNGAVSMNTNQNQNYRNAVWMVNGSVINSSGSRVIGNTSSAVYSTQLPARTRSIHLNGSSDYVELAMYHNTGQTRTTNVTDEYQPHMEVKYVGPPGRADLLNLE